MSDYGISNYNAMVADKIRTGAYVEALRRAIHPGAVVVDIGTGTGILALVACKLGASRVYAIEPGESLAVAKMVARQNGCADRIEFVSALSTETSLPQRADVIVADLRDTLPLFRNLIPSLIDARERLLAPGGVMIPVADELWATLVESPRLYRRHSAAAVDEFSNLDLTPIGRFLGNSWSSQTVEADECIAEYKRVATLDYRTIDSPNVKMNGDWLLARAGTSHGLCLWFDAKLTDEVGFSGSPSSRKMVYSHAFFPFAEPLAVHPGDRITVALEAILAGDDYLWRWDTRLSRNGESATAEISLYQSTMEQAVLSKERFQRRSDAFVPPVDSRHEHWRFVLERLDGSAPLGVVAQSLSERFPETFGEWSKALTFVGDVVEATG